MNNLCLTNLNYTLRAEGLNIRSVNSNLSKEASIHCAEYNTAYLFIGTKGAFDLNLSNNNFGTVVSFQNILISLDAIKNTLYFAFPAFSSIDIFGKSFDFSKKEGFRFYLCSNSASYFFNKTLWQ